MANLRWGRRMRRWHNFKNSFFGTGRQVGRGADNRALLSFAQACWVSTPEMLFVVVLVRLFR